MDTYKVEDRVTIEFKDDLWHIVEPGWELLNESSSDDDERINFGTIVCRHGPITAEAFDGFRAKEIERLNKIFTRGPIPDYVLKTIEIDRERYIEKPVCCVHLICPEEIMDDYRDPWFCSNHGNEKCPEHGELSGFHYCSLLCVVEGERKG